MTSDFFPALPASVQRRSVSVNGIELNYYRAGSGQPLLLIPGWSFSAEVFTRQLTELSANFDVIALDPRGHGKSSKPLTANGYVQRGNDLSEFINALDLSDIVLAGRSFGTLDALSYLEQFGSDRVAKLILIDEPPQVPYDPTDSAQWGEAPLSLDGLPGFLRFSANNPSGFAQYIAAHAAGLDENTPADDPNLVRVLELVAETPEHIAIITAADGLSADYSATAIAFAQEKPVLFFARQEWVEPARAWVSTNLPTARFAELEHHASFAIDYEEFNQTVREFIAG